MYVYIPVTSHMLPGTCVCAFTLNFYNFCKLNNIYIRAHCGVKKDYPSIPKLHLFVTGNTGTGQLSKMSQEVHIRNMLNVITGMR